MVVSRFYEEIKNAKIEREVEDVYNKGIELYYTKGTNLQIEHPHACDGCLEKVIERNNEKKILKLLIEYKYDEELQNDVSRAKVLVQVLYYLKRFEGNGEKLPNVIMVGDINEVFVIHSNDLMDYLDENVDWSIAPSNAHEKNPELIMKIAKDDKINPFVFAVDNKFSFKEVADKINNLTMNVKRRVRVTEHNISTIFDYFTSKVLKDSNKIAPNDLVGIFINSIIDKENCYKHPHNQNLLVANGKHIQINGKIYDSFFSHFEKEYTPQEKNKFTEISDRLIEDTKRRRSGEFYTPTLFTDYAHKMLSEQLGEDWKEKYVVWDCCWGTGNLTRDYQFKELYASTLEQAELDCGQRYNPEATKFIFDFLNDDITNLFGSKLPPKLYEALDQNKPIVFFINPPYGTASNAGATGTSKQGCAKTKVNEIMLEHKIGNCSQNLYTQFLYKIHLITEQFKLNNVVIALYSPILFLTGESYKNFRAVFLNSFKFNDGIQFKASCFSDVSDSWGISFSIWENGYTVNKEDFLYKLIEYDDENEALKISANKTMYNLDNELMASKWAKSEEKSIEKINVLCFKSAINHGDKIKTLGKGYISCFANDANNIDGNGQGVYFINTPITRHVAITEVRNDNFIKTTTLFAARRLITQNWYNWSDEYKIPNINHTKWQEFCNDSIIYSLFESKSQQSSLRNINYNNQTWNIKNEFFFMSKNDIMALANENNFDLTYNDARVSEERFVYKKLQEIELSKEAQDVLNKAIELTKKSFKYREMFNQEHPEYQIMNWDCGWYQIKAVLKEYFADDLKEFQELYKILADKMRPMVYELGFLK